MELQLFIKDSLLQIVNAVNEANEEYGGIGQSTTGRMAQDNQSRSQTVNFDLAITTTDATETNGKISVLGGFLGLSSSGQSNAENISYSRISFTVPITFNHKDN